MKPILFSVSFLFFIESTALLWSQPLYMLLLWVNKAAKRAQIKVRLQPSFMIRPYKVIKKIVHFQASTFLFFIYFFESLMSASAGQILTADG